MMNLVLLLVFATVVIKVCLGDEPVKCCSTDEVLAKKEESYYCTKDLTSRHQINVRNTNFLNNSENGTCLDVFNNDFVTFNSETEEIKTHNGSVFTKCCPLNRIYNSKLHSCIENPHTNLNFVNETFVKVGLPECRIVADFDLDFEEDFRYNLSDITRALKRASAADLHTFCFDRNERNSFVLRECQELEDCKKSRCIKKCCPDGRSFVNGSICVDTYEHGLNLSSLGSFVENPQDKFSIIHNRTCKQIYKMSPAANITVHQNGSFTERSPHGTRTVDVTDMNSYCIEHTARGKMNGYYFFHCFIEQRDVSKFETRLWPFVLSCVFLLLTVLVYVLIREYRKVFGKILVSYCITSFMLFAILLWHQLFRPGSHADCEARSFLLIFFALAQFTWANVMSFEIWCTFGTTKLSLGTRLKDMELKKFALYCLYGWGVPSAVTLFIFLFYEWRVLPDAIQPYLAGERCFFEYREGNYAKFLFFGIPLLLIQMINTAFFVKTVMYCIKVKNDINRINDAHKNYSAKKFQYDKERLYLIIKLSVVMGISFIWEVVTGFFNMSELGEGPKYLEIVLDIYNALQGVFIFIIFICKRKVLKACMQVLNVGVSKTHNSVSTRTQSSMTINGVVLNNFGRQPGIPTFPYVKVANYRI